MHPSSQAELGIAQFVAGFLALLTASRWRRHVRFLSSSAMRAHLPRLVLTQHPSSRKHPKTRSFPCQKDANFPKWVGATKKAGAAWEEKAPAKRINQVRRTMQGT